MGNDFIINNLEFDVIDVETENLKVDGLIKDSNFKKDETKNMIMKLWNYYYQIHIR